MNLSFDPAQPIYTQIVDGIRLEICSGALSPGERLPSVRDLALQLKVNPNTLQRAFGELEREELLYTERTSGRFVTQDTALIERTRRRVLDALTRDFYLKMLALGCDIDEIQSLIKRSGEHED